jgi:ribosomal protein S15P/S13E
MVGQRKRQLEYIHQTDPEAYQKLIARLDLRK